MAMSHEIQKLLPAPLEDVLLRLYPVAVLKWLYEVNLRTLAETYPQALPQPARAQLSGPDKAPKKAYLIDLLLVVLRDKDLGRRFFETLPQTTRDAVAAVTWERRVNLAGLEQTLGREIAVANPDERRIWYEPFLLPAEHGLLVVLKNAHDTYGYFSGRDQPKKADYVLLLPDAIRKVFKTFVPPPAGYELLPLDTVPASARSRYGCVHKAIADLRLVAEYIAQGHLKYTKAERVALPSLKILRQMTGGPEFFENPADGDLALLRTRLLVGGMAFAGDKEREALLAGADSATPVRKLLEKVLANPAFLHEELLGHLPLSRNRWCQYSAGSTAALTTCFRKLPVGKWVSWENLRSYHTLREQVPTVFAQTTSSLQAYATKSTDTWSTSTYVSESNQFELVGEPLLKGLAFLLAAFGLAEIAYVQPEQAAYRRPKKTYLTPYDGLRFLSLTPLGEFVFGGRTTYEVADGPPTRSPIVLDSERLLATCRDPDALTELALGQFLEKLAPGRYRMTPKSLVGGCRSRADIEERVRLFRRVVSPTPPEIWEAFFQRTLARIAPLKPEPDYLVLKVGAEEEIRRLFASDAALREIVLKVEGLRIAVRQSDLKQLAKRLEQFGYLSPIATLTAGPASAAR